MGSVLGQLTQWVTDVVHSMGYVGVAILIALENLFPPIPSEIILPLTGFLVGRGRFSFLPALLAATIGSVAGALILYGIGRWLSEERLRGLVRKYGKYLLLGEDDLDRGHDWFERHGRGAVFVGRLVPGVRSVISVPAGLERMPVWKFVAYTAAGSGLWNTALIGLGWVLGDQWQTLSQYLGYVQYAVLAAIAAAVIWFVYRRAREHG